jgi:gamma-glutamylcysteine synthetase
MLTDEEARQAALKFAKDWASNVRLALRKAIDKTAGR